MQKSFILIFILAAFVSCKNAEIEHPDFAYTTGFFPYQYPVRTLILGDDIYDNSNDNAHKFLISAAMGGVYANKRDRSFTFQLDESLCADATFGSGAPIQALPAAYYQLSSPNTILIPNGKANGGVEVQLTEAFFNDPKSISLGYVVPLVLTDSQDVDSILVGKSPRITPDRRQASHWSILPKDFTMFAIKYINEFHGNYFHSGEAYVANAAGERLEEKVYRKDFLEQNEVRLLTTTARHQVQLSTHLRTDTLSGPINLMLNFEGNSCTITSADTAYTVAGSGEFKKGAYSWGNKERNGIEINYTISKGTLTYHAKEVLVARDRAVTMEVFTPTIKL